jgi:hypothetical protein
MRLHVLFHHHHRLDSSLDLVCIVGDLLLLIQVKVKNMEDDVAGRSRWRKQGMQGNIRASWQHRLLLVPSPFQHKIPISTDHV